MATTGGMYSGLLETNQELAKAKELESNAISTGLEQGVKPLQKYLIGLANEKKQRETDLKKDQGLAITQMNMMADTSGLLGDYEPIVTGLAQTTKNTLNNIAKDESLSQYEKAAKYKEAVDAFNKQVSKYSGDQEIIAGITGQYAKGTMSQAIDMTGDDYIIGKALSSGNFKIQGDRYIIEGIDGVVDSSRLKNLYIPENNEAADKYSGQFGALGLATDDLKKLEAGSRQLSLAAGNTQQATEALAAMGVDSAELYSDKKENIYKTNGEFDLIKMQEEIYKLGLDKAKLTFIAKTPPIIKASTAQLMAKDAKFVIEDAMASGNFSFLMSKNAKFAGQQIVDATFSGGKLSITTEDKEGFGVPALETIDLNTALGRKQVGEIILSQAPGSQSVKGEAVSLFNDSYNQPKDPKQEPEETVEVGKILSPQQQVTNWGTIVSDKEDRKIISSALYNITTPEIRGSARQENNPTGLNSKRDQELIGKNGKVADVIVVTEEFKDLYPNYPYSAYGQDDASMLAKIPRTVKRSIINKLNIKDNTEIADIYNNKISLERYNQLQEIANLTPDEKSYLALVSSKVSNLENSVQL